MQTLIFPLDYLIGFALLKVTALVGYLHVMEDSKNILLNINNREN